MSNEIEKAFLNQLFEKDTIYLSTDESEEQSESVSEKVKTLTDSARITNEAVEKKSEAEEAENIAVLVLVDEQFGEAEKDTLSKILKAINFSLQEAEIIKEHPKSLKDLQVSLFLSFNNEYVESQEYTHSLINKTTIIYANSITDLNANKEMKLKLWNLLKKLSL